MWHSSGFLLKVFNLEGLPIPHYYARGVPAWLPYNQEDVDLERAYFVPQIKDFYRELVNLGKETKYNLTDGVQYSGKAIKSYNKEKKQWGWKLL
jgi:hypothetical protein